MRIHALVPGLLGAVATCGFVLAASRSHADGPSRAPEAELRLTGTQVVALNTCLPDFVGYLATKPGKKAALVDHNVVVTLKKSDLIEVDFFKPGKVGGGILYVLRPPYTRIERRLLTK